MKRESTPSMSLVNSVLEENLDAKRGRKTLTQNDGETEYPQENGLRVEKLSWFRKLCGCRFGDRQHTVKNVTVRANPQY